MASAAVLASGVFTFEVGPEKQRFVVHKKAIEDHSPVLAALMNNGCMQESTTEVAYLDDTSPQTFGLFAEYIYTGMYRVVQPPPDMASPWSQAPYERTFRTNCWKCGPRTIVGELHCVPTNCPTCHTQAVDVDFVDDVGDGLRVKRAMLDSVRKSYYERYKHPKSVSPAMAELWKLHYPALGRTHQNLKNHLAKLFPPDQITEDVSSHALLYVFAQKYMVESLQALCLHKLHRDLLGFKVNSGNITEIVELVTYAYDNTSSIDLDTASTGEPPLVQPSNLDSNQGQELSVSPSDFIEEGLRALVMTYSIANAKKLLEFPAFQIMLQQGGEVVGDFMTGLMQLLPDEL